MLNKKALFNHEKRKSGSLRTESEPISDIDASIGDRIKQKRLTLGMTQKRLGESVGVTPQQIQKYECALNRVSCSTLYNFAKTLEERPEYFFSGFTGIFPNDNIDNRLSEDKGDFIHGENRIPEREIIKLVNMYRHIKSNMVRKKFIELLDAIVKMV
jgi:transcriptional regulator with XRE-family HTH domain